MSKQATPIRAHDEIILPVPPEQVWRLLADVGGYPRWWPASQRLRLVSEGTAAVGAEVELHPAGGQAFRCRIAAAEPPSRMEVQYCGGFVEGTGEWRLEPCESGTRLSYRIDARAHGVLIALLARTVDLGAVHSRQMREVFQNLSRELHERTGGP